MKSQTRYFWICTDCLKVSRKNWKHGKPARRAGQCHMFRTGHLPYLAKYEPLKGVSYSTI